MKLALVGWGRMGRAVEAEALAEGHAVVGRFNREDLSEGVEALADRLAQADVVVDFSSAEQVRRTAEAAARAGVDLVVGTTGWRREEVPLDRVAAAGGGVVHGANFSLGVQAFLRLAREAARLANAVGGYDAHVDETHHRHKRDKPSGTAIRVAEAMLGELDAKQGWILGPPDGLADPGTLYVTSVRSGEVTGTHVIGFEGPDDRLELRHEARSRAGFARGALKAAEWVRERSGVFSFEEVVADLLDSNSARSRGK